MVRGLYTAALGMMTQLNRLDVYSNNIANSATTSYKKDSVITQSFSEELMKRLDDPDKNHMTHSVTVGNMRLGVFVDVIVTDYSSGVFERTDDPLDFAISGDGFFNVAIPTEGGQVIRYTRDGSFETRDGILTTRAGFPVLGQNGPITLGDGDMFVTDDGEIYINNEYVDRLIITTFEDNSTLRKYKDNFFNTTEDSVITGNTGKVRQGGLEASNANNVRDMVDVITVNRQYESNQRVISVIDQTLGKAVNEVAHR